MTITPDVARAELSEINLRLDAYNTATSLSDGLSEIDRLCQRVNELADIVFPTGVPMREIEAAPFFAASLPAGSLIRRACEEGLPPGAQDTILSVTEVWHRATVTYLEDHETDVQGPESGWIALAAMNLQTNQVPLLLFSKFRSNWDSELRNLCKERITDWYTLTGEPNPENVAESVLMRMENPDEESE